MYLVSHVETYICSDNDKLTFDIITELSGVNLHVECIC